MSDRPIVHLFIGLHKTGSSAIRFILDTYRDALPRHGYHLPRAAWTRHINGFWNGGHNNIPWQIYDNQRFLPQYGGIDELVAEIAAHPTRQHLVVTEDLDHAEDRHLQRLQEAFAGFDVRVVLFVRNQLDWVRSMGAEDQKWFGARTFEQWSRDVQHDPRLDYAHLAGRWQAVFGTMTVVPYERVRHRVFDAFLECCGASAAMRAEFAERPQPLVNVTHSDLTLAVLRAASDYAREQGVPAEYFNTVITPAVQTAFAAVAHDPGRSATLPGEVADAIITKMTVSNARLAERFGVDLGPAYLNPVPPSGAEAGAGPSSSLGMWGQVIAACCFDVGIRAGAQLRRLEPEKGDIVPQRVADRYYPFSAACAPEPSQLLDDLLADVVDAGATALHLERQGDRVIASAEVDGVLLTLREIDDWRGLWSALDTRAGLNRSSWNNLREGVLSLNARNRIWRFGLRAVPTTQGDLAIAERLDDGLTDAVSHSTHTLEVHS